MKKLNLLCSKSGKFSTGMVNKAVIAIIIILVLITIYSVVIPEAQTAGDSMNISQQCSAAGCVYNGSHVNASISDATCLAEAGNQGATCGTSIRAIPLANLFSGTGVVFVIIMAALLVLIIKAYLNQKSGK